MNPPPICLDDDDDEAIGRLLPAPAVEALCSFLPELYRLGLPCRVFGPLVCDPSPVETLELTPADGRREAILLADVGLAKDLALRRNPLKNVSYEGKG